MDLRVLAKLYLLISAWVLTLEARVESSSGSVVFFDLTSHSYIRQQPLEVADEKNSMQLDEVTAAVSVLLGLAPPASLSAESSSKLNEILLPNLFERPDTLLLLEIGGIDGFFLSTQHSDFKVGNHFHSMLLGSTNAKIQFSGEQNVDVVHVDEAACGEDNDFCVDQELTEFAKWFGGSYTGSRSHDGKLIIPLSTGSSLDLHVSQEVDGSFATRLASLVENTKRSALVNGFTQNSKRSAELLIGCFQGLEALEVKYGKGDMLKLGEQLVKDSLIKLLNTIQTSSGGKVVCVLLSSKDTSHYTKNMLEVTKVPRFTRWLDEISPANETIAEIKQVLLVRRTLAWITAIIVLIATLVGVYLLMNMTLTRDTLLYSNVKLD